MTRMTGPDCAVMCNLINIYTHTRARAIIICNIILHLIQRQRQAGALNVQNQTSLMAISRASVPSVGPSLDLDDFPNLLKLRPQ